MNDVGDNSNSGDNRFDMPDKSERRDELINLLNDYETAALTATEATIAIVEGKNQLKKYSTTGEPMPDRLRNKSETIRNDLQKLAEDFDEIKREQTPGADKYSIDPVAKYPVLGKLEHHMYINRTDEGIIDQIYDYLAVSSIFLFPIFLYLIIDAVVNIDGLRRNILIVLIGAIFGFTLLLRMTYIRKKEPS